MFGNYTSADLQRQKGVTKNNVELPAPAVVVHIEKRANVRHTDDVHESIEAAVPADSLAAGALHILALQRIGHDGEAFHLSCNCVGESRVTVDAGNSRPRLR